MRRELRQKLSTRIEFVAGSHQAGFDPEAIAREVLDLLSSAERQDIMMGVLIQAVRNWIGAHKAQVESAQMTFPEFPHVPALIKTGQRFIALESATIKELDDYFVLLSHRIETRKQSLGAQVKEIAKETRAQLRERLSEEQQKLRELRRLRSIVKLYSRWTPDITVGEALARKEAAAKKERV